MAVGNGRTPTSVVVPAQGGAVVGLAPGDRLRIADVEGSQVADMFAVSATDPHEWLSVAVSRAWNWRLFPAVGEFFWSTAGRPLLTFERDDSPGFHDMMFAPCSAEMYRALDHVGHHPSCSDNFRAQAAEVDWHPLHVPDPVNFFQRTRIVHDGALTALPAASRPGDSVTLRAEAAVFVVVTACAMDLEPINGDHCTAVHLDIQPHGASAV